jgi:plastocyanin
MRTAAVTKHGRRSTAAIGALSVSLAMAACGGGDDGGTQGPATPSAPKAAGTTVDMVDLAFKPRALTIGRGQTVTFRNRGKVTHNAKGKDFFSSVVEPGGSYRHTFRRAGTFEYVCTFHPGMEGTLTVR